MAEQLGILKRHGAASSGVTARCQVNVTGSSQHSPSRANGSYTRAELDSSLSSKGADTASACARPQWLCANWSAISLTGHVAPLAVPVPVPLHAQEQHQPPDQTLISDHVQAHLGTTTVRGSQQCARGSMPLPQDALLTDCSRTCTVRRAGQLDLGSQQVMYRQALCIC